jgi:hypothetical protein
MPCSWLSLDAMDISGDMHLDVVRRGGVHISLRTRVPPPSLPPNTHMRARACARVYACTNRPTCCSALWSSVSRYHIILLHCVDMSLCTYSSR